MIYDYTTKEGELIIKLYNDEDVDYIKEIEPIDSYAIDLKNNEGHKIFDAEFNDKVVSFKKWLYDNYDEYFDDYIKLRNTYRDLSSYFTKYEYSFVGTDVIIKCKDEKLDIEKRISFVNKLGVKVNSVTFRKRLEDFSHWLMINYGGRTIPKKIKGELIFKIKNFIIF